MSEIIGKSFNGDDMRIPLSDVARFLNDAGVEIDPATIQPADDQRKAMLDEIREKINNLTEYKTFVRVEGDPVPTLPQIDKWCVIWILDETEAKL